MSTISAVAIWGPIAQSGSSLSGSGQSGTAHEGPTVPDISQPLVRLTRRGRLLRALVLMLLFVLVAGLGVARLTGEPARAGAADAVAPVMTTQVSVAQGDSLWSIARRVAPEADPRDVVYRLRELNGLPSNLIQPGQVLLVPSGL